MILPHILRHVTRHVDADDSGVDQLAGEALEDVAQTVVFATALKVPNKKTEIHQPVRHRDLADLELVGQRRNQLLNRPVVVRPNRLTNLRENQTPWA